MWRSRNRAPWVRPRRYNDVGGLQVPMDDEPAMRMLDSLAHAQKQQQPLAHAEFGGAPVNGDTLDQFHHQIGPAIAPLWPASSRRTIEGCWSVASNWRSFRKRSRHPARQASARSNFSATVC